MKNYVVVLSENELEILKFLVLSRKLELKNMQSDDFDCSDDVQQMSDMYQLLRSSLVLK